MDRRHNVETLVVLQPVAVDTASPDRVGMLVLANGLLVGLLIRLDTPEHEDEGDWFAETLLGRLKGARAPTFSTLDEATRWFRVQLRREPAAK